MTKNNPHRTIFAQTYITDETKKKWEKHILITRPKYTSMSHFLEEAAEYKIKADNLYGTIGLLKK